MSEPSREFPPERELVTGVLHVSNVDRLQIADGAACHRGAVQRHRFSARQPPELAERRGNPEHLVIDDGDLDNMCLANVGGVLGYRVKHWLHIARRIGDYAENVGDRRLLLQRLVALAGEPRDLCLVSLQRTNCDGARPLAHCGALALPPCGVAL